MKVQVNDAENSQKELIVELPYESFADTVEKELVKLLPTVKIPGFRPGKAPKDVVKKQYEHKVRSNAIERLINDAIRDAMTSNGIMPLSQPNVYDVEFDEDKPIKFKAKVDVFPSVELNKYSGNDFECVEVSITDKDIDNSIESLRQNNMTYELVKNRKVVKDGDIAVIDFEGKLDGVAFDGGTAKEFSLNIGSGQFIPGFEDGVIGMKIGEKKDIPLTFPKEYQAENLAGKEVIFTVKLHEIKEKVMPELDEAFVKTIDPNSSTIEELKTRLKKGLTADYANRVKFELFSSMLVQIVADNPFDVPYSFAKEQAERMAYQSMTQFYQMGLDPEQVGITFDMMVERHIEDAKEQVKQALVINEIAKKEGIVIEEADIDKFLGHHADIQGRPVEDLRKEVEAQNMLESLKNDILSQKVREYLESVNSVKTKKMTKDAYDKAQQPNNEAEPEKKPAKKAAPKKKAEDKADDKPAKKAAPKKATTKTAAKASDDKPKATRKKKSDSAE